MRLPRRSKIVLVTASILMLSASLNASEFPTYLGDPYAANDRYMQSSFGPDDQMTTYSAPEPSIPLVLRRGLSQTANYLRQQNPNLTVAKLGAKVSNRVLAQTLNHLLNWNGRIEPDSLHQEFDLVAISNKPNTTSKFTGYYTPIIQASAKPSAQFRYPIYRSPMAGSLRLLSREAITQGALKNKRLEIAWTNDPVGLFYMQIQGSGILQYSDGRRTALHFDGSNEKPYRSIARYMQQRGYLNGNLGREKIQQWLHANPTHLKQVLNSNPRYVFFRPEAKGVLTASGLPIIPGHSIAVDTNYIPFGSVVLAEVPIINSRGQRQGAEWKLLLPQDRGAAIKGPGRMDIYTGKGEDARQIANQLTGHGRAYMLVKRGHTQLSQGQSQTLNLAYAQ